MLNPNVNALPAGIAGGTTNNVPAHLEEVKDAINGGSLLRRLTQAQIDALSGATRPTGLAVVNLTRGCQQMWTGAAWVDIAAVPDWQGWAPTLTQGVAVAWSAGSSRARFVQAGKTVQACCRLAVAGAGTAGQPITLTLPVAAAAPGAGGGSFSHFDVGVVLYAGWADVASVGSLSFAANGANVSHGINAGTLSAGDVLSVAVTFEAA